ncbi:Crp/Fnr family transcriptional regulator [Phaeobacter sp. A36a-5a]|uniref:Crp/Fnr family transcriptional regulator n=1 Tax=Phaeobacter bryozoorum TaxID=1086632 RepID=UPI0030CA0464
MTEAQTPWIERFPGLARLDDKTKAHILAQSSQLSLPRGTVIFGPGKSPENMLFLLDGTVRVQQVSETGREILLYRINAGESCVLTTACLLAYEDYAAEGIAETAVTAAILPRAVFDALVAASADFRSFVFSAFSKRITDLFLVIDEVAFQRVDVRLAQALLDLAAAGDHLAVTHQQLAVDLGTAREVVSRQIQEFQRRGWVQLARGRVDILDREALQRLIRR